MKPRLVSAADLPHTPDPVAAWIRLDRLTRRVVGRRMEHGRTPETNEMLDKLMVGMDGAAAGELIVGGGRPTAGMNTRLLMAAAAMTPRGIRFERVADRRTSP
jgi:hypothetical protein